VRSVSEKMEPALSESLSAILLIVLGGVLGIGGRVWLEKYIGARAESAAADMDLPRRLARAFSEEGAKTAATRLDRTKAESAMKILGLMAEVDATLFSWKFTAFFRLDELGESDTVEDVGIADLKKVSLLLIALLREASSTSVLLGDDVLADVMAWVGKIHETAFDFHAAYTTSKNANSGKPPDHTDRVRTVSNLMENAVYPAMEPLADMRKQLRDKLSSRIESAPEGYVR